jgi:hypothetical protein
MQGDFARWGNTMRVISSYLFGLLALVSVAMTSSPARAAWLGLANGKYDVTLSCVSSTVISCPSTIDGTMRIGGAGATAFDFTVNGQAFIGAPTNGTVSTVVGTDEYSFVDLSPFSFVSLQHFLTGGFPGLTADSWGYCNNFDPTHCTPATSGNWTAKLVSVPEPAGWAMMLLGFGAVGATMRAAHRKAVASAS